MNIILVLLTILALAGCGRWDSSGDLWRAVQHQQKDK